MTTMPHPIEEMFITSHSEDNNTQFTAMNSSPKPQRVEDLANVEVAVQTFIFIFAICGNVSVLLILARRKKKISRMHLFIMHLSIADLLVALLNILPQTVWDITHRWEGGDFLCRVVKYMQVFVLYLSTFILVLTAIDRYRAICHPLSNHTWTPRLVHVMVCASYIMAALFSIPQLILFKYQETEVDGIKDCWVYFSPQWTLHLYIITFSVLIYLIPFIVLVACYGSICYTVWKKYQLSTASGKYVSRDFDSNITTDIISTPGSKRNLRVSLRYHSYTGFSKAKLKTVKLTFTIILTYVLCWSPFIISQLWWLFDESAPLTNHVLVIMLLLASLNSCCNPLIYLAFSGHHMANIRPCRTWQAQEGHVTRMCCCKIPREVLKKHVEQFRGPTEKELSELPS